jgi:hypothetical protein
MFNLPSLNHRSSFELLILILCANLIIVYISYFYYLNTLEGITSSFRMLLSATLIYTICNKIKQNEFLVYLMYFMIFNGCLIGLQVFEQVANINILPLFLKYGGLWGFSETNDYEVFKKGGIFPSTQSSSILSLLIAAFIIYKKKSIFLLAPITLGIFFGGRTTLILLFMLILLIIMQVTWSRLIRRQRLKNVPAKHILKIALSVFLTSSLAITWFNSDIGAHHLTRITQVFDVIIAFDLSGGESGGSAFEFYSLPTGIEALIGNGLGRYHESGGNDAFYSRWLLQSGIFSLTLMLFVYLICFFIERKRTPSFGFVTLLLLVHGLKGEVITSVFVFDLYLLYIFSKTSIKSKDK